MDSIEAKVILPAWPQFTSYHILFEQTVTRTFGGFTVTTGRGSWINGTGHEVGEPVNIYTVALPASGPMAAAAVERLRQIAVNAAHGMLQEALYFSVGGEAEIISLGENAQPQPANDNPLDKRIDVV